MSLPKAHMKKEKSFETLCGRPIFANIARSPHSTNTYFVHNKDFVDCKSCLKVLAKRGG